MENLDEIYADILSAIDRFRQIIYGLNVADKTINQLIDEENIFACSIMANIAVLKALLKDIEYLQKIK